jgi:hypothetical protein
MNIPGGLVVVSNSHVIEDIRWLPCNGCGGEIGVPADWVDFQVKCPECGTTVKGHGTLLYRSANVVQPIALGAQEPSEPRPEYEQAYEMAVSKKKPLVIFVGVPAHKVKGAIAIGLDDYDGNDAPRIIAGMPGKTGRVLPVDTSDERIHDTLFKQEVQPPDTTIVGPLLKAANFISDEGWQVQPPDTAIVGPLSHARDARIQKAGEIVLFWGIACVALGWTVIVPFVSVILFLDLSDRTGKQKDSIPTQGWIGFALTATFGFVQTITVVRYLVMH